MLYLLYAYCLSLEDTGTAELDRIHTCFTSKGPIDIHICNTKLHIYPGCQRDMLQIEHRAFVSVDQTGWVIYSMTLLKLTRNRVPERMTVYRSLERV